MNTPTMQLLDWAARREPEAAERVGQALLLAQRANRNQYRRNGDSYMDHAVAVALIVASSGADDDSVVTAVLHDVLDEPASVPLGLVRREFGGVVADLLEAFKELDDSPAVTAVDVLGTVDPRVLHLKIADRLHNMRTIDCLEPATQCHKADQTHDVIAPVARAVGLDDLAHELDTLAAATLRAHAPAQHHRGRTERPGIRTLQGALRLAGVLLPLHRRDPLLQDWEGELHAAGNLAERVHFTASVLLRLPHLALITRRTDRP